MRKRGGALGRKCTRTVLESQTGRRREPWPRSHRAGGQDCCGHSDEPLHPDALPLLYSRATCTLDDGKIRGPGPANDLFSTRQDQVTSRHITRSESRTLRHKRKPLETSQNEGAKDLAIKFWRQCLNRWSEPTLVFKSRLRADSDGAQIGMRDDTDYQHTDS